MHLQLKEKLIILECSNLTQLVARASKIKQFIQEKEQKKANRVNRGPHLMSIIDSYMLMEIIDFSEKQLSEVMAVEIIKESLICASH